MECSCPQGLIPGSFLCRLHLIRTTTMQGPCKSWPPRAGVPSLEGGGTGATSETETHAFVQPSQISADKIAARCNFQQPSSTAGGLGIFGLLRSGFWDFREILSNAVGGSHTKQRHSTAMRHHAHSGCRMLAPQTLENTSLHAILEGSSPPCCGPALAPHPAQCCDRPHDLCPRDVVGVHWHLERSAFVTVLLSAVLDGACCS